MLRPIFRLLLLAYFVMPLLSVFLVVLTLVQIRNDVTPVFEAANAAISSASAALENEVRNLGNSFAPLISAVNALRAGLQAVVNFIRDTVYTLIDVVNSINVACSIGRTACIPKSFNITLPTLIDLSFINNISRNITAITTQVNTVITTTTTTITSYAAMLTLAVMLFVAWMLLTYVLFIVFLYSGLWRRT
jgi:hypothetical protein